MKQLQRRALWSWRRAAGLAGILIGLLGSGCAKTPPPAQSKPDPYPPLPYADVPDYLKETVLERTVLAGDSTEVYPVSGYGLVVGLAGTGNNTGIPTSVRTYMIREMVKHGFDSSTFGQRYRAMQPERILDDPGTSIVEVWGAVPPGARKGQKIDVLVQTLRGSNTTSLKHGRLYRTRLAENGADPIDPAGAIRVYGSAAGEVCVNPASVTEAASRPAVRDSLRKGTVMDGGEFTEDRPLILRLCHPSFPTARQMQYRITDAFQGVSSQAAAAQDEAILWVTVPERFHGDWKHFLEVTRHLYLNGSPGYTASKARQLAEVALTDPAARLEDISFCWEGMGPPAVPFIQPLYLNANPKIAFAAARAGAYLGDFAAQETLLAMAQTSNHPLQLDAVKVLGDLPQTPRVDRMLAALLSAKRSQVRIEAYSILARHGYYSIHSAQVGGFTLDLVSTDGPPMIYASRTGTPRLAVFGADLAVALPITFSAMDYRFTISSNDENTVSLFYRGPEPEKPISMKSKPDLQELIVRMGADDGLRFDYADIMGVLQTMCARKDIPAVFVLQDLPQETGGEVIQDLGPGGRPAGDGAAKGGGGIFLAPPPGAKTP